MSPEQARGEDLDARTDLFSLGVVLYEMATGRHPFKGSSTAAIFDEILNKVPASPVRLNPDVPAKLEEVIHKCLEKNRDLRCQSAIELRADLKRLARDTSSGLAAAEATAEAPRRRGKAGWWVAAGVAIVAGALAWWFRPDPPPMTITPFTTDGGYKASPQLSPDGEKVAYEWRGDIYIKALAPGSRSLRLTEDEAPEAYPVWSPDSRQVAFRRDRTLYSVPALGGQERKLADVELANLTGAGLSWSPDGEWIALVEQTADAPARIVRLSLATLSEEPLTSPPADSRKGDEHPAISPDGRSVAFVRTGPLGWGDLDVWIQSVSGGEARRLTPAGYTGCQAPVWTTDGKSILFSASSRSGFRTFRVGLDGREPEPVQGLGVQAVFPSVRGHRMVFQQRTIPPRDLWRVPARPTATEAREPERLIASSATDANADFSLDGRRITFSSSRGGDLANIWISDSDGTNPVQRTRFERGAGTPLVPGRPLDRLRQRRGR